jgi:hypothetical protein
MNIPMSKLQEGYRRSQKWKKWWLHMMYLGARLSQKAEKPVREDDPTADNVEILRGRMKVMAERLEKKSTE